MKKKRKKRKGLYGLKFNSLKLGHLLIPNWKANLIIKELLNLSCMQIGKAPQAPMTTT